MEGRSEYLSQAIHNTNLKKSLTKTSVALRFPQFSRSFAGKLLNAEETTRRIHEIKSLSSEVVFHRRIKTETDNVEIGKVYVFEVEVCWERDNLGIAYKVQSFLR